MVGYKYPRRVVKKSKKITKLAKGKETQITTLAKAVRLLQTKMRKEPEYLNFSQNFSNANLNSSAPLVQNLTYYTGMNPIFGVASDDLEANKIIHKSVGLDIRVTLENSVNNEEETIGFTAFIISLKDDIGPYFLPGTGAIQWTNDITHTIQNGMVLLNKKMFNIHNQKRFHLSNYGTALSAPAAQTQYGTDQRWYWKCSINKIVSNPGGNWKALQSALDPSKCYFLVIFSDNSTIDLESPSCSLTAVHTMQTVA